MREAGAIDFIKQFTFKDWDFLDQPRETIQDHVVRLKTLHGRSSFNLESTFKTSNTIQYHPSWASFVHKNPSRQCHQLSKTSFLLPGIDPHPQPQRFYPETNPRIFDGSDRWSTSPFSRTLRSGSWISRHMAHGVFFNEFVGRSWRSMG